MTTIIESVKQAIMRFVIPVVFYEIINVQCVLV